MSDHAEVLDRILDDMGRGMEKSARAKAIRKKIGAGKATYADAEAYARETSRIMTGSMQKNVPEALTDGRLYREAADIVIRQPMQESGRKVIEIAAEIQELLNDGAGIGIGAIRPKLNEDQITGIITGICNADSYEAGEDTLYSRIENYLEGTVDDCVRENADFQYRAGLSPKIERRADGKCCKWCSVLAGTYDYEDVRGSGNDVFRRHKNCHCQVLFNPGDGSKKRQNVHSRKWTEEGQDDRIGFAKRGVREGRFNTTADPMREVFGPGEESHPDEIRLFRQEIAENGVDLIERDYECLGYSPATYAGQPGQIFVSKGASYSAWCHEVQHMRDDKAAGWSGMRILRNLDECYRREANGYNIEIEMAEKAGRQDIADRLRENLETERRHIYGSN